MTSCPHLTSQISRIWVFVLVSICTIVNQAFHLWFTYGLETSQCESAVTLLGDISTSQKDMDLHLSAGCRRSTVHNPDSMEKASTPPLWWDLRPVVRILAGSFGLHAVFNLSLYHSLCNSDNTLIYQHLVEDPKTLSMTLAVSMGLTHSVT